MSAPSGFVTTRSSLLKKPETLDFENVTFVSHKSKLHSAKPGTSPEEKPKPPENPVDLKKLRYEVIKLGTSGMDATNKQASSIALAVALGAKPPKKKYTNYKDILAAKKAEKEKQAASAASGDSSRVQPSQPSRRHLYVVGSKVIPAKPKSKEGVKNFLGSYGKPGRAKMGKGFKKKRNN